MKLFRADKGASLVEFALILPVLVVLLFGIIEFGLLLYDKAMITNAARESARAGIVYQPSPRLPQSNIEGIATNYCDRRLITFSDNPPNVTVEMAVRQNPGDTTETPYDPNTFTRGQYLRVTTTYDYDFLVFPNVLRLLNTLGVTDMPTTIRLTSTSIMRSE